MPRRVFAREADGEVVSWGSPDIKHLLDVQPGHIEEVLAWSVLWVSVWVTYANQRRHGHGWQLYATFAVEDYDVLRPTFDAYFGTCGLYKRLRFEVEHWIWTAEGGWEAEDNC